MKHSTLLREAVRVTGTELWCDSAGADDLAYALESGATGATSNPPIVLGVVRSEGDRWPGRSGVGQPGRQALRVARGAAHHKVGVGRHTGLPGHRTRIQQALQRHDLGPQRGLAVGLIRI